MIRFPCPHCGKRFKIDDAYAGRSTKCPDCARRITVPRASQTDGRSPSSDVRPTEPPTHAHESATRSAGALPQGVRRQPAAAPAGAMREPLDPRLKMLSAVFGGFLIMVIVISLMVRGVTSTVSAGGYSQEIAFVLPPPSGGGQAADLAGDAKKLQAIDAAVKKFASGNGNIMPGHVGECIGDKRLDAKVFVSVRRDDAKPPEYRPTQDPYGPYRFGDFVFMYVNIDGRTLPGDAIVAASARGDGQGSRVLLQADGKTKIVDHDTFITSMKQQNLLRRQAWGRLPQISPKLFEP